MRKLSFGTGALAGALLTGALIGVMYFADQLAGLPFIPFDLFDWIARVLPGAVVTFGIDLMIDAMRLVGMSVAAKRQDGGEGYGDSAILRRRRGGRGALFRGLSGFVAHGPTSQWGW